MGGQPLPIHVCIYLQTYLQTTFPQAKKPAAQRGSTSTSDGVSHGDRCSE